MKNTKQVSEELGISERMIRKHAQNLGIKKVGRDYVLTNADIKHIKNRLGKWGRPCQQQPK